MQQRQPRLGDVLDDYCPRERRVTNHAVVAMIGDEVKQTRCTTCDAEHVYKHAKVPRQRRKGDTPAALYGQVLAGVAPKKVTHETVPAAQGTPEADEAIAPREPDAEQAVAVAADEADGPAFDADELFDDESAGAAPVEEGPVHRPLIRATLPRTEGQPPATRPAPEFTIRQPGGRPNRFRPRHGRGGGGHGFQGFGANGNTGGRGGGPRHGGGRPPMGAGGGARPAKRHDGRGKRSK